MKRIILIFAVSMISIATQANALLIVQDYTGWANDTDWANDALTANFNINELANEDFSNFSGWVDSFDWDYFNSYFNDLDGDGFNFSGWGGSGWWRTSGGGNLGGGGNNSSVPEPATILLFGAGLIGLAGISRCKIKK